MKHFCVIGDPVEHSLSPRLHRRMIELTGLDATYDLCPVRAQELERFVEQARGGAWDGFNVTMPHKEAVVPYLDGLSGTAARCRAVNTVCMEDGRAIGHNTDGLGFIESLRAHGFDPADKTALIIGTGGAGEAVTDALVQAGARLVYICNRSVYRAQALAARYPEHEGQRHWAEACPTAWQDGEKTRDEVREGCNERAIADALFAQAAQAAQTEEAAS